MQSVFSFRVWNKLLADDSLLDTLGYDGWGAAERLSKNKKIMQSFSSRAENEHNRPYYPLIPQNCRYPCSIVALQYSCIKLLFLCKGIYFNQWTAVLSRHIHSAVFVCVWVWVSEISHDVVHYVKSCGVMVGMGSWMVACRVFSQTHKPCVCFRLLLYRSSPLARAWDPRTTRGL